MSFAVILAGGKGRRMSGAAADKILAPLAGKPVIAHSIRAFLLAKIITDIVIVHRDETQKNAIQNAIDDLRGEIPAEFFKVNFHFTRGGVERQDSVFNGLCACPNDTGFVFIHDAARPLINENSLKKLLETAQKNGTAALARRVTDTIKQMPPGADEMAPARLRDLERSTLWAMETPQVFRLKAIRGAYEKIIEQKIKVTDDTAAFECENLPVTLVENHSPNPKITTSGDLALLEFLLGRETQKIAEEFQK